MARSLAKERRGGQDTGRAPVHASHIAGLQRGISQAAHLLSPQHFAHYRGLQFAA